MPNGGWGSKGPVLDTTTWFSAKNGDRFTQRHNISLQGWHTIVMTAVNGVATYSLDGKDLKQFGQVLSARGHGGQLQHLVREPAFAAGTRTWDTKVNWFYYNAKQAMSLADVQKTVTDFYGSGTNYVNTVPKP